MPIVEITYIDSMCYSYTELEKQEIIWNWQSESEEKVDTDTRESEESEVKDDQV